MACRSFVWLALLSIALTGGASTAIADTSLASLINQRLSMMKDVAAYKYVNGLAIENKAREKVVIDSAVNTGLEHGITVSSASAFFSVQIEAAKVIQQCWFERWHKTSESLNPPDLNKIVRPRLIELGNDITAALGSTIDEASFNAKVNVDCLDEATKTDLLLALKSINRYENRLAQIVDSGILRVGTTGDYAPFSHSDGHDTYTGADIDMAEDLAASLGVTVQYVATSWPDLMKDLRANRYDIAMSGVSRTVKRARHGYFSIPYHVGGKTPITRCENVDRFDEMTKIDQQGVTLIVNPGGTNEKFLDARIKNAAKLLHNDNRTIFDEIANGSADLMITDAIEVALQSNLKPALCPAMPGKTLTYQEKGYLMPQDGPLQQAVNLWLSNRIGDGTAAAILDRYLNPQ